MPRYLTFTRLQRTTSRGQALNRIRIICLATALVAGVLNVASVESAGTIKVRTLEGHPAMLSEFFEPGKWTLVMIWTTYCGVCKQQFPMISAFHDAHHDTDVKVVGIALDGFHYVDEIQAYLAQWQLSFDSLIGELSEISPGVEEATGQRFSGTPTYLLFDTQGQISALKVGPIKVDEIQRFIHDNPS